ncbi:MAG: HD domain-containing protein [Spirochaetales bacterium]|jgi:poly(A) polymerase|nr:HD domain-containing protein [Spirochaetales bacterium]
MFYRDAPAASAVLDALRAAGIQALYTRFSALDRFFRVSASPVLSLRVSCGLIDLAKLFPALRYPGIEGADAALLCEDHSPPEPRRVEIYFTCIDGEGSAADLRENPCFDVLRLLYNPFTGAFCDPRGIYPLLRAAAVRPRGGRWSAAALMEAAVLISRYAYSLENLAAGGPSGEGFPPETTRAFPPEVQRGLLACILSGQNAFAGLRLLGDSGFLDALWPELACMREVSHSKEYHPEGDVWDHTLETFRYRKNTGLTIALALLLHDAGKPRAEAAGGRRFDKHAEIGALIAEKFLNRLGFPPALTGDVVFLVRNHMLPGVIKTLPACRTQGIMESPLFPMLLEVYRCDLSSTFRGPDGYYEACKVYRAFLKHRKNPYRGSDGKKIRKMGDYVAI